MSVEIWVGFLGLTCTLGVLKFDPYSMWWGWRQIASSDSRILWYLVYWMVWTGVVATTKRECRERECSECTLVLPALPWTKESTHRVCKKRPPVWKHCWRISGGHFVTSRCKAPRWWGVGEDFVSPRNGWSEKSRNFPYDSYYSICGW